MCLQPAAGHTRARATRGQPRLQQLFFKNSCHVQRTGQLRLVFAQIQYGTPLAPPCAPGTHALPQCVGLAHQRSRAEGHVLLCEERHHSKRMPRHATGRRRARRKEGTRKTGTGKRENGPLNGERGMGTGRAGSLGEEGSTRSLRSRHGYSVTTHRADVLVKLVRRAVLQPVRHNHGFQRQQIGSGSALSLA